MRKMKLNIEALNVESFTTAEADKAQGTVLGHVKTNGAVTQCRSAYDACPTGFCAPTYDAACTNTCETYDPALCPSVNDACPSSRGCTEIDCA
jgi:hypothetical protein